MKKVTKPKKKKIVREEFLEINYKEKVGEKLYSDILETDPTFNKQYSQWIFNLYLKLTTDEQKDIFKEDLYKVKDDLKLFYKHKEKLALEKRDITNFKNLTELYEAIRELASNPDSLQSKSELLKETKKEIDVLLDNDNWMVLIPKTKNSSIIYGKGTRWCTASENYNYFENYSKDGPLYIIIDKQIKTSEKDYSKIYKHQFHFESDQFMNADDVRIDHIAFLGKYPELLSVFASMKNGFGLTLKLLFGLPIPESEKEITLPAGKTLNLSSIKCDTLPENLIIHGSLNLEKSDHIKSLKNITVNGDLFLAQSSIEKIEGKLYVQGKLDLENCQKFTTLPDGFFVGSSLRAKYCDIKELPRGVVKGMIYVSSNLLFKTISRDLIAEKNIYANDTLIPSMEESEYREKYPNIKDTLFSHIKKK